ncbi:AsmA family protein [Luminiphilus sp.]|nr:AsmA family protein [Luminiphilus sp.]
MHALRNSLLGATAFIALLAVVALTADLGVFRPLYEQLASDLLKREVRILGPLEVRLGRHLEVFAEEISISGVVPNGDPFLSVGAASLALQLTTLVDDEITISSATLRDVTLNLDTRHNSNDNQDNPLPTTSPAPDASRPAPKSALAYRLRAHNVSINNADIVWRSETSQQPIVLQVTSLTEELNDTTLVLSSAGLVNGKPYATDLTIRDVESLLVVDDWLIDWAGTIGSATFEAAARLDSLESIGTSELSLSVHADSANQLLATLALPTIEEGPIDIAVALSQQGKRLALNLDALFGEFHFIGDGSIDDVQTFESSHLNLIAEGPSLSHLGSVMGQPNWPETPFEIDIEAAQNGVKIDVPLVMLQSDAVSLSLAGGFADYRQPSTGALDGTIDIPSLGRWGAALALPPELIGPVNGSVSLKRTQGGADIEVRTESPFASLAIAGRLEPGEAMLGSTVSIRGKMDDPDRLLSLMTETSTQLPAATFEGNLSIESPELARVSELRISVGQNELVATGLLGWFSQRYATRIGVSLESDSLQSSVDPFVRNADSVPPLPVLARAMITYRTSQQFSIEEGELQLAGGEGRFSGVLSLTDIKPVLSGDWDLTFPQLQPLLTQFTLPDYLEQPVTFSGHVAWREGQLGISAGQLQFGTALVTGNLLLNQHSKLMQFDLDAQAPDLSLYLPEAMQLQNKPAIPISLRSTGSVTPDAWHLETLQLDSTQAVISGSGLLERDGDEFIDSHLDAEIKIANLSPFSSWLARPLPDQDLRLSVELDSRAGVLLIEQLELLSGDSDLSVTGRATNPSFPELTLTGQSQLINLAPWMRTVRAGKADMPSEIAPASPTPPVAQLIPDYPISFDAWKGFEADISLDIDNLTGLVRPLEDLQSAFSLQRDGLRVDELSFDDGVAGSVSLSGSLLAQDTTPQLDLALNGESLIYGIPKAPQEDANALPTYDVKLRLTGSGATTRTLASSLNGYLNLAMGSGHILNTGFDRLSNTFLQELSNALNPFTEQQAMTAINCAAVFNTIENGEAFGQPSIVVDTPKVKILADTHVSFDTEKVKASFKTIPQKGLGINMSSLVNPFVEVTGTLSAPRISLNPANTVVGGSLAVVTGGISLLIRSVLERLSTGGNICAKRLQKANEAMSELDS